MNYTTSTATATTTATSNINHRMTHSMRLTEPYPTSTHNNSSSPSTWQQLVVGAGSAAGSTAAVVSEESMKCLRYCVSWLQYAIRNLGQQMSLLRGFLVSLATNSNQQQQQPVVLATIKKDMVSTLRKVIDIITCYASNALPYQAKATIRGTILNLPSRWASLYDETNTADNDVIQQQTNTSESYKQEDVALRLLAFGQESSDMLSSIHTVIDDTIQRAESWLERLRLINPMSSLSATSLSSTMAHQLPALSINHHTTKEEFSNSNEDDDFYNVLLPPILNLHISSSSSTETTTAASKS
ncbi:hypothetical protein MAM1_0021c01823 [Mucor ambiguus]|uniref:Opi1-domain-containing protein n=1 Tax=Mucor ambiguus TaxID=91626 RepID=A0A0C9LRX2_9FUNG|nr:hypothetical protein MAM1_0021c01823 [Mucor ambiguus]